MKQSISFVKHKMLSVKCAQAFLSLPRKSYVPHTLLNQNTYNYMYFLCIFFYTDNAILIPITLQTLL